ncbi:hypothetical protein [Desulfonatronospira thiodismutans]|nr:hypothetical protein [Desulfonatronospira thiodismutans]
MQLAKLLRFFWEGVDERTNFSVREAKKGVEKEFSLRSIFYWFNRWGMLA